MCGTPQRSRMTVTLSRRPRRGILPSIVASDAFASSSNVSGVLERKATSAIPNAAKLQHPRHARVPARFARDDKRAVRLAGRATVGPQEKFQHFDEARVRDGERLPVGVALARSRLVRDDEVELRYDHDVLANGTVSGICTLERAGRLRAVPDPPEIAVAIRPVPMLRRIHLGHARERLRALVDPVRGDDLAPVPV